MGFPTLKHCFSQYVRLKVCLVCTKSSWLFQTSLATPRNSHFTYSSVLLNIFRLFSSSISRKRTFHADFFMSLPKFSNILPRPPPLPSFSVNLHFPINFLHFWLITLWRWPFYVRFLSFYFFVLGLRRRVCWLAGVETVCRLAAGRHCAPLQLCFSWCLLLLRPLLACSHTY